MGLFRMSVNEVYFGRTPEVEACFQQFCKFRDKYIIKGSYKYSPNINTDTDLIQFNRMMEDCFGFEAFELYIINSNTVNAFTFGTRSFLSPNPKKALVKTPNGIKYDKQAGLACLVFMYTGLLCNEEFTDGELFAAILHEVGHNFQEAMVKPICDLSSIYSVIALMYEIINGILSGNINLTINAIEAIGLWSNEGQKIVAKLERITRNKNAFLSFVNWCITFRSMLMDAINDIRDSILGLVPFYGLYRAFYALVQKSLTIIIGAVPLIYNTAGEYYADSFATMYGFGPEMTSIQYKFRNVRGMSGPVSNIVDNVPILRTITALNTVPLCIVSTMFDPHPTYIARMQSSFEQLERELKSSDLDPKMRKLIESDAKKTKDILDDTLKKAKEMDSEQKNMFFAAFCYHVYKATGSDTKDWVKKMINVFEYTDKAYNEIPDAKKVIESIQFK